MSRLEQMRENFLKKIQNEQFQEYQLLSSQNHLSSPSSRLMARSTMNILESLRFQQQLILRDCSRKTPLRPTLSAKSCYNRQVTTSIQKSQTTISRVKSLNNISMTQSQDSMSSALKNFINNRRNSNQNSCIKTTPSTTTTASNNSYVNSNVNNSNNHHHSKINTNRHHLAMNGNGANKVNTIVNDNISKQSSPSSRANPNSEVNNNNNNNNNIIKRYNNSQANNKNKLQCKHCNRKFSAKDRLDKHMEICAKIFQKQRPIFQSSKQRMKQQQVNDDDNNNKSNEKNSATNNQKNQLNKIHVSSSSSESNPVLPVTSDNNQSSTTSSSSSNWKVNRQRFLEKLKQDRIKNNNSNKNLFNSVDLIDIVIDKSDNSNNKENNSQVITSCIYCGKNFTNETIVRQHETFCNKFN